MGDAVLVRSVIEHLRRRNPSLEIGVLAGEATQELLTVGGNFTLHLYSQRRLTLWSTLRMLREIKARSYDAVLNFEQGSLAGSCFLYATAIPSRIGFVAEGPSSKMLFLTDAVGFQTEASMWQSFLEIARIVDSHLPDSLLPLPLPISDEQLHAGHTWLQLRLTNPQVRKIAFHLGCGIGQAFKRWPLQNFAALAGKFSQYNSDLTIILTGQPHERGLVTQFGSIYKGSTIDATGLNSISETASVLKECDLLVSNDTGVMHLGAAMGTPTVGLFGASSPHQWAPSGPRVAHVYATSTPCSPCINSYLNLVPTRCVNSDYGRCMADIRVDSVLDAARRVILSDWLG
jgi:heptosyltransferase II